MSDQFQLHDLKPDPGSRRARRRYGRGPGGKGNKTAGRGTKGLKARNTLRPGFEGGQTPMSMRIPKLKGFRNPNKVAYAILNLPTLNQFAAGSVVDPDELRKRGLVKHEGPVKVLGMGEIDRAMTVKADAFSESARRKIEAAGGTAEVLSPPAGGRAGEAGRGES
jgi:large subunit ribosomal protein L15